MSLIDYAAQEAHQILRFTKPGGMEHREVGDTGLAYKDSVVSKSDPTNTDGTGDPASTATRVRQGSGERKIEGVTLDDDKVIRSKKTITDSSGRVAFTFLLDKDNKGTVEDNTDYKASKAIGALQEQMNALRQAQMCIESYNVNSGLPLIIDRGTPDRADRLHAALLYLIDNTPALEGVKVENRVPGCIGPKGTWVPYTDGRASFVKEKLADVPKHTQEAVLTEVQSVREAKFNDSRRSADAAQTFRSAMIEGRVAAIGAAGTSGTVTKSDFTKPTPKPH